MFIVTTDWKQPKYPLIGNMSKITWATWYNRILSMICKEWGKPIYVDMERSIRDLYS